MAKKAADQLIKDLQKSLNGPTSSAAASGRYVGAQGHPQRKPDEQSRLKYWGHALPTLRALAKKYSADASTPEEQWLVWRDVFFASDVADIKTVALIWMSAKKLAPLRRKNARDLFAMAEIIDNWAHSDGLSSMLAEVLEAEPGHLKTYKKWNHSSNPWLRRQSIVGIYCYARQRKRHVPARTVLGLIENLLEDPHFYVQRGVGWTLREVDRVDPVLQKKFVEKNLHRIGGTAWFATSELYPTALRRRLVESRRRKRRS